MSAVFGGKGTQNVLYSSLLFLSFQLVAALDHVVHGCVSVLGHTQCGESRAGVKCEDCDMVGREGLPYSPFSATIWVALVSSHPLSHTSSQCEMWERKGCLHPGLWCGLRTMVPVATWECQVRQYQLGFSWGLLMPTFPGAQEVSRAMR